MIEELPKNSGYIALDLLGFGKSPVATWSAYDARSQARSVRLTCRLLGFRGPVVVVGHSLGGLVAVELARHSPRFISRLVLCSPPLYETSDDQNRTQENLLRRFYEQISKQPKFIVDSYALGQRIGFAPASLNVSLANVDNFIVSLQSAIINQRTIPPRS
jgi:pimeloyl-ACP methyl ester carboxylesterase